MPSSIFQTGSYAQVNRTSGIALAKLADLLIRYLVEEKSLDEAIAAAAVNPTQKKTQGSPKDTATPKRQQRHKG